MHVGLSIHLTSLQHPPSVRQQKYFGAAVGKGRQGAKTEIEKLKLTETNTVDAVKEGAKM